MTVYLHFGHRGYSSGVPRHSRMLGSSFECTGFYEARVILRQPATSFRWPIETNCGYRKFKICLNGGPPAIVTEIVAEIITLALGKVREQALSWKAGALFGGKIRNAPAS